MDFGNLFDTIMTDERISKSNIAARFQNAFTQHILPPIGVFWDIENCQVPKGKSAIALVQNIRERFFVNHREAEFMCVCDINKESKIVIQELLFAQVTIVHISATSKNAADDKLKQCMKRYVDTHGSPSSLLLISDDVNFASDLSDFRHRHNIHIILIHRGHAHQSLLACAHEHYNFYTINKDLPFRSPLKSYDIRPNELEIRDLPIDRKESHVRNQLQKLSSNCGGKVIYIRGRHALIRFANGDAAEKAKKRMDKELVFGNRISVNFRARSDVEGSDSPPRIPNQDSNSSLGSFSSSSPKSSRDSSYSPPTHRRRRNTSNLMTESERKFDFPAPPIINNENYPSLLKQSNSTSLEIYAEEGACFQPSSSHMDHFSELQVNTNWDKSQSGSFSKKCQDISAFSPFKKNSEQNFKKLSHRNIGRVSPFYMQENDTFVSNFAVGDHPHVSSYAYSSNDYQTYPQNTTVPFNSIQRISDPVLCSSQWNGTSSLPVNSSHSVSRNIASDSLPVELLVSNLDSSFEVNEMKKALLSVFSEHVMVLHISMSLQPDGTAKAIVKVPTMQDAQYAISRLHRKKIGHKRILISHLTSERNPPLHILKSETIALLNDIPAKNLPLIKFRELFERRYHRPIAISELYKMKDAVSIQGESGNRMVYLNVDFCKAPSLSESEDSQDYGIVEKPFCERHFRVSDSQGWAEQYSIRPLPTVCISLKNLSPAVHMLLDTHQGSIPLVSFCACYEAEIGPLPIFDNCENSVKVTLAANPVSSKDLKGVPLEHLIACVTGVEVAKSVLCIKKVQWQENKSQDLQIAQNFSPALAGQLTLFGREVMDLLKSQPQCLVPFNKFIPTYHHHFGRQCRVADYGFTKLIDLLEAIPHIVQVLGEGQNRQVTLTHRTQIKRFAAELLRILKSRASKQIAISEFAQMYEQVIEKPFDVTNYGVCEISDLLSEVPDSVVVNSIPFINSMITPMFIFIHNQISISGNDRMISIPKRDQTEEEIQRTKEFAKEVLELMKHTPCCSMSFNRFIPAYHHHFGKQCRVADYGFTKLIELFEAIPHILEVKGTGEDKVLCLVDTEQHKIVTNRLVSIIKSHPNEVIEINQISSAYAEIHGHALKAEDFGFADLHELLESMNSSLRVVIGYGHTYVTIIDHKLVQKTSFNLRFLLMEQQDGKMSVDDLCKLYQTRFGQKINLSLYLPDMKDILEVDGDFLQLCDLHLLARDIILLLQKVSQIPLLVFGNMFEKEYGMPFNVEKFGFSDIYSLFENLSDYFTIKGKKLKRNIYLNTDNIRTPLSDWSNKWNFSAQINRDILNDPIPTSLPSPSLQPVAKDNLVNLMGFETPPVNNSTSSHEILHLEKIKKEPECTICTSENEVNRLPLNVLSLSNQCFAFSLPEIPVKIETNVCHDSNILSMCSSSQNREDIQNKSEIKYMNSFLANSPKETVMSNSSTGSVDKCVLQISDLSSESCSSNLKSVNKLLNKKNRIAAQFRVSIDD